MIELLPAGSTFAGYQVDAVLARGGMGVVYLATELRPRRRIALKLIAPALAADPAYRERFLREVDTLAALEHPNVVPMHAAGEWEGQLYLAMRFLDGPDLAEVVRTRGHLPSAEVIALLAPIADALDVAHGRGIVHRDVTPSNIRLDARGIPYLTDFGLTKRAATSGPTALTLGPMGTPAYMAPEQFAHDAAAPAPDPALAPRADVYALGCVLVTLLTGAPPYPRDTYEAALWAHVHADPPAISERVPGLPATLDAVVARAIAKDPAARFPTPGALVAAARAVLAGNRRARMAGGISHGRHRPGRRATRPIQSEAAPQDIGRRRPDRRGRRARRSRRRLRRRRRAARRRIDGRRALRLADPVGRGGSPADAAPDSTAHPAADADAIADSVPNSLAHPGSHAARRCARERRPTSRLGSAPGAQRLQLGGGDVRDGAGRARLLGQGHEGGALRPVGRRRRPPVPLGPVRRAGRDDGRRPLRGRRGGHRTLGRRGHLRALRRDPRPARLQRREDGDARVDWTVNDAPIWATLWRYDEDIAAAYGTWSEARLNPLREPR